MRGQYFSFDAIIATVIMVIAMTSLVSYWFGTQSVIESRLHSLYSDASRIAESLLSPGSPPDWEKQELYAAKQIGLCSDFSGKLSKEKLERMKRLIGIGYSSAGDFEQNYAEIGRLLRAGGNYLVVIEQTDDASGVLYEFGKRYPQNATEVAVAHRGATLDGKPMRMRVFLWR
ncbi:MAG: hypothetical protein N3E51_01140 [Candidatus Micrarchaeota archaeon]|nr:hypothetical protein [Candidatus Micrarchaeota archaeon]